MARNTDINLVIKARNEADSALKAVSGLLSGLGDEASDANNLVAALSQAIGLLDKAMGGLATAESKASQSASKHAESIHAATAGIQEQQQRVETLSRGLAILAAEADKAFIGPKRDGLSSLLKTAKTELSSAESQLAKFTAAQDRGVASIRASRSGLLDLKRSMAELADSQAAAAAKIELTSAALREQTEAEQRVTALQARINITTGVSRPDATGSAAGAASILLEADNIFRRAEARQAEIAKLREQELAIAELGRAELAERANRQQFGITEDPRGKQAAESAAVFIAAAKEEEAAANERATAVAKAAQEQIEVDAQMEREAVNLRNRLDPLAAIQAKFNAELVRFRELAAAGKITANELAAAELHLADEAKNAEAAFKRQNVSGTGKATLFGLKPYELQNLSYQFNDVVTQLASGTKLSQVLAQQGGQILQLFPKVGGAIFSVAKNPLFLALAATVGSIALALKEAADHAERLRSFTSTLKLRADGGNYDPQALADQERALVRLGAAAGDAETALKSFLDRGVNPARIAQFSQAAQDSADVLSIKLADAAGQVGEAFTGGYKAIADFDDKLNFLTTTQREHIRTLFEEGNAEQARTEALNIFSAKMSEVAENSRGPWSDAARSLRVAWGTFIDYVSDRQWVTNLGESLDYLANRALSLVEKLNGARTVASLTKDYDDLIDRIGKLNESIGKFGDPFGAKQSQIDELVGRGKAILKQIDAAKAAIGKPPSGDTITGDPNSVRNKQRSDKLAAISLEEELQRLRDAGQARILSNAEKARRAELAGIAAAKAESDEVVAAAVKRKAIAHETAEIEKSNRERAQQAATEAARLAKQTVFIDPVNGPVTSGFGPRKSPGGVGSTFHQGRDFGVPVGTSVHAPADGVVVETGYDTRLGKYVLIDHGNKVQSKFGHLSDNQVVSVGQTVTKGQVIAKSGNTGTATTGAHLHETILVNGKPVDPAKGVFPVDGAKRFQINPAEALQDFENEREKALERSIERQDSLDLSIQHTNEDRLRSIESLRAENGLQGEALLVEQRKQIVDRAELELRQKVEDANRNLKDGETPAVVTPEQVAEVRKLEAALFDAAHARELLNARQADAQRPSDDLQQQVDLLRQQAEFLRSVGDESGAQQVEKQITALQAKLRDALDTLIEFYRALSPEERVELGILDQQQLDNLIEKLKQAKQSTQEWGKIAGISAKDIAQAFASAEVGAVNSFLEKVANGQNVLQAFGEAMLEMAANFASAIAQMILQLLAYAAAVAILKALGVPVPGGNLFGGGAPGTAPTGLPSPTAIPIHHSGGIVGSANGVRRTVDPAIFAGAMRFHTGGIPGLRAGEVAAILKNDEEVLTSDDPRHRWSGGSDQAAQRPQDIKIVNAIDSGSVVSEGMQTRTGQRSFINMIQANKRTVKAILAD